MLLADRYDDRAHFIFELLQNAEDALARRPDWQGTRGVEFRLSNDVLSVVHCGKPFDERDVRGICGIAESTKDLTAIGRFGIGFKSVYAFTNRPEVHSGAEDFAIESFVWPTAIPAVDRGPDETLFILPLAEDDEPARREITEGLRRLGARSLLFLRQIDEIAWSVDDGPSGLYIRGTPEKVGENAYRIVLLGEERGKPDGKETWLLFSREAMTEDGTLAGRVEIAFSIVQDENTAEWSIQRVTDSPLVVFFPTVLPTHLQFLVQGPYRTTPSRDNVPRGDSWNQRLVQVTADLLVDALRWMRDKNLLDAAALQCLPMDSARFGESNMFSPLFERTRSALLSEPLLPTFNGQRVVAGNARLGRTQELRELLSPSQLGWLFNQSGDAVWLTGDITQDRTPDLRHYLMRELNIAEIGPETILSRLDKGFLEAQSDEWIRSLYEFLGGQPGLRRRLDDLPLIRIEDGTHVTAQANSQPQAFLPSTIVTNFPTVRASVCSTEAALDLLKGLGLTEPDPVDDVVWNLLPKYRADADPVDLDDATYEADLRRILTAFATDSKTQREKLLAALRDTAFVMAVDAGDGSKRASKSDEVYLATDRLKELFGGVAEVLLVDNDFTCLRGEQVRDLLEACGASRCLQLVPVECTLSYKELRDLRNGAGCENMTWSYTPYDYSLRGLDKLLATLPKLDDVSKAKKGRLLWEALGDVQERRGSGAFTGTYRWTYYHARSATFDVGFVRQLNEVAWVPGPNGDLQKPEFIVFNTLNWKANPFLLAKIRFKPPIIETLAKEAGIEPGVIDLLKKLGVTREAELRTKLGLLEDVTEESAGDPGAPGPATVEDALRGLLGGASPPTLPVPDPASSEPSRLNGDRTSGQGPGGSTGPEEARGSHNGGSGGAGPKGGGTPAPGAGHRASGGGGTKPFISYVAAHPEDEEPDPDGLDQKARMDLEEKAIVRILAVEPTLRRTPAQNPGFDLLEADGVGQPVRWVEVKAMTGELSDRPVGLSHAQFHCAREHAEAFWLYVVEHAADDRARIVRIQDPARRAKTFTFDHGWLSVADISDDARLSGEGIAVQ
jgi:hypothetical protein